MAKVLRSVGYVVVEACDGLDARALLRSMRFDAVILSLRMPRLDGRPSSPRSRSRRPSSFCRRPDSMTRRARAGSAIVAELTNPVSPQRLIDAWR